MRRRPDSGHSLVEFAFLAPVMMLLVFGMIDLGRGFYYQVEVTDAARDAARVLAGQASASSTTGPGSTAGCNEATRDLANIGVANVTCTTGTPTTPGTAFVAINCGYAGDCATPAAAPSGCGITASNPNNTGHYSTCVQVTVSYLLSFLSPQIQNLGGPTVLVTDTAQMVTVW